MEKKTLNKVMKKSAAMLALAASILTATPMTALADRGSSHKGASQQKVIVVKGKNHRQSAHSKVVVVDKKTHRHKVGQRLSRKEAVVVHNWRERGLSQPKRGETYVINGDSIYLVAAATLLVKALVD